jgi:hypothetical protein
VFVCSRWAPTLASMALMFKMGSKLYTKVSTHLIAADIQRSNRNMKYDYEHCSPPLRRRCPSRSRPRPSRHGPERSWSGTCAVESHRGQEPPWAERWWSRQRQGPVQSPAGSLQGALRQRLPIAARPDESPWRFRCVQASRLTVRRSTARDRGAVQLHAVQEP